jgi:hypothetical protein
MLVRREWRRVVEHSGNLFRFAVSAGWWAVALGVAGPSRGQAPPVLPAPTVVGRPVELTAKEFKQEEAAASLLTLHEGVNDVDVYGVGHSDDTVTSALPYFTLKAKIIIIVGDGGSDFTMQNLYLIMAPGPRSDFSSVPIQGSGGAFWPSISDSPDQRDESNSLRVIRFANYNIRSIRQTFLFVAERSNFTRAKWHPTTVRISVFKLIPASPALFIRAMSYKTSKLYCNCDAALLNELGVPLRVGFTGAKSADGCVNGKVDG